MERKRVIAKLITDGDKLPFRAEAYSKFKHGGSKEKASFAADLTAKLYDTLREYTKRKENITICVYGAPYNKVPTASTWLALAVFENLERMYKNTNLTFKFGKVSREHSYHADYGKMSQSQREKCLSKEDFTADKIAETADIFLLIDDIYITGAHERRMIGVFESYNKPMILGYYAMLQEGCCKPDIESKLNLNAVDTPNKFYNFLYNQAKNRTLDLNTRAVKFMLHKDRSEVLKLVVQDLQKDKHVLSARELTDSLMYCAISNEYNKHAYYSKSFNYLKNLKNESRS